jgi:hypothetical protein
MPNSGRGETFTRNGQNDAVDSVTAFSSGASAENFFPVPHHAVYPMVQRGSIVNKFRTQSIVHATMERCGSSVALGASRCD